jgi:RNA polymerase sigma factor (sigma-70 family)
MPSDEELLAAWRAGDRAAGSALIERHFDALYRFFRATVPSHAEDLVQETLAACVRERDQFQQRGSFRGYLFAIARNAARMHWRTHGRRGPHVDLDEVCLEDLEMTPTQVFARREDERLLLRALRRIPLESQILLLLYFWEDMAGPALAELLGCPEGTVRSRLRRARQLLEAAIAALASSPELLRTTLDNLERWIRSMREHVGREPSSAP